MMPLVDAELFSCLEYFTNSLGDKVKNPDGLMLVFRGNANMPRFEIESVPHELSDDFEPAKIGGLSRVVVFQAARSTFDDSIKESFNTDFEFLEPTLKKWFEQIKECRRAEIREVTRKAEEEMRRVKKNEDDTRKKLRELHGKPTMPEHVLAERDK